MNMSRKTVYHFKKKMLCLVVAVLCGAGIIQDSSPISAQINTKINKEAPATDAKTTEIVDTANAFLSTLRDSQKEAVLFPFTDSEQRSHHQSKQLFDFFSLGF